MARIIMVAWLSDVGDIAMYLLDGNDCFRPLSRESLAYVLMFHRMAA